MLLALSLLMIPCVILTEEIKFRYQDPWSNPVHAIGQACVLLALLCWLGGWVLAVGVLQRSGQLGVLVWIWLVTGAILLGAFLLLLITFVAG